MGPSSSPQLDGIGVLVTRPAHQAQGLCRRIEQLGGSPIRFPTIEISDPSDLQALFRAGRCLERYDYAVFVSANAVQRGLVRILAGRRWPGTLPIAVVGKRSAKELERFGLRADLCPQNRFNSEALLELPALRDVQGKRIVIFRGDGGRELLAETLRQRGARVDYVEAYRRTCPRADAGPLLQAWRAGQIDIALCNSAASLDNLFTMLGEQGRPLLCATQLLVVSDRMVPLAMQRGFQSRPVVADNATDAAVIEALLRWKVRRGAAALSK
jgi:uroporphyrinogen-III synthase